MENYDVIIIGAGPAGSIAAYWAEKLGLNACIIDKAIFPRDKICGDGIPPLAVELINELNLPTEELKKTSKLMGLFDFFEHDDTTQLDMKNSGMLISRFNFDFFLWRNIPSSVKKYQGASIRVISKNKFKNKYKLRIVVNELEVYLTTSFIIGADGVNSWIRKKSGYFNNFDIQFTKASRVYAELKDSTDNCLISYDYGDTLSYNWKFPIENNRYNIGCYLSFEKRLSKNKRDAILDFGNKHNLIIDWKTFRGASIPTFNNTNSFSKKGIFLVGDAAGLSEPVFGHGIDTAMLSGKIAIQCIKKGLVKKNILISSSYLAANYYNNFMKLEICPNFQNMRNVLEKNLKINKLDLLNMMAKNTILNKNIL